MKSICIYSGSSEGNDSEYLRSAKEMGASMARRKIDMVYGGAKIGLMGAAATACLNAGGSVVGVIPKFLDRVEVSNYDVTELIITKSMHERKTIMAEKSDAFISLPGGFGTLEELSEILTWNQLGLIQKPIGIFNFNGFYDKLIELFQHMFTQGFIKQSNFDLFVEDKEVEALLDKIQNFNTTETSYSEKLGLT